MSKVKYNKSERFDILSLAMENDKKVFAYKKIAKDKPTPKYPGLLVTRSES